jgi:hypothetical protein
MIFDGDDENLLSATSVNILASVLNDSRPSALAPLSKTGLTI